MRLSILFVFVLFLLGKKNSKKPVYAGAPAGGECSTTIVTNNVPKKDSKDRESTLQHMLLGCSDR